MSKENKDKERMENTDCSLLEDEALDSITGGPLCSDRKIQTRGFSLKKTPRQGVSILRRWTRR